MIVLPVFNPDMIVIAGFLRIKWYGFMYVLGFLAAWLLAKERVHRIGMNQDSLMDFFVYFALGIIVGGRLGYMLIYHFSYFISAPWTVFYVWNGGMAFHGALVGGLIATALFATKHSISVIRLIDFTAPLLPPGLFLGRLGNFINGELWGRVTDVSWGMVFPHSDGLVRHPSQLYEMLGEGLLLFLLMDLHRKRSTERHGVLGAWFLIHYGWIRFFLEFFREPDGHLGFVLFDYFSMGQCLCLLMFIAGLGWLLALHSRNKLISAPTTHLS